MGRPIFPTHNCGGPQSIHPLLQEPMKCYLKWEKGLYKCDEVKYLGMGRFFWIMHVGPTGVLVRGKWGVQEG